MGFHVCEYCHNATSSGDVTLTFENGHSYIVPDMITHYATVHHAAFEKEFVHDIMFGELVSGDRVQTKGAPTPIGYLSGPFPTGTYFQFFYQRLATLLEQAEEAGNRGQTRGI